MYWPIQIYTKTIENRYIQVSIIAIANNHNFLERFALVSKWIFWGKGANTECWPNLFMYRNEIEQQESQVRLLITKKA